MVETGHSDLRGQSEGQIGQTCGPRVPKTCSMTVLSSSSPSFGQRVRRHLGRRLRGLRLRGTELNLALGRSEQAKQALIRDAASLPNSRRVRQAVAKAFGDGPIPPELVKLRFAGYDGRIRGMAKKKDYPGLLKLALRYEAEGKPMPLAVGEVLARQIVSSPGRQRLCAAAEEALTEAPDSPYLLYLYASTKAKEEDPAGAGARVSEAIEALFAADLPDEEAQEEARRRFGILRDAWRVTDQIAREATGWADDIGGGTYSDLALIGRSKEGKAGPLVGRLNFKEPLLQARDEERYLAACLEEFEAQTRLLDKIRLLSEMLRQGVRRQKSYARAWDQANRCYDGLKADTELLADLTDPTDGPEVMTTLRTLINAMNVLRKLERAADVQAIKTRILSLVDAMEEQTGQVDRAAWLVLPELVVEGGEDWTERAQELRWRLPDMPAREYELRAFLKWTLHTRAFAEADRIFEGLPRKLATCQAALFYVNILQRQSRFGEALRVLRGVNAASLARPAQIRPHAHWSVLRRYGEIKFLSDTAKAFARVPQPADPRGVIVIAARNIDQLRKYPLAVLIELRRQGWAVLSLVEGLLPFATSENEDVNLLSGCIAIERTLTPWAESVFPQLEGYEPAPGEGRVDWMGLNLSHSLMEDARIARRSFDVDFTCPALRQDLTRLTRWTELMSRAMVHARETLPDQGVRVGFLSLFNSRLPDSVFRLYCDVKGDEEDFFALQTANGYENYFANFGNPISTRCVIRNVTKHPEVRSGSFPTPANFTSYVETNHGRAPEVLDRVRTIALAKRTQGPDPAARDPEAVALEERCTAFREKGGRVVCLFGRVVCDSAVPFDGGPAHQDLKDWVNHSIDAVRGAEDTLLLIKPHPHEMNEQIATYLNQHFRDLIPEDLPENVIYMGHRWFTIEDLQRFVDLGTVYNGTVAVEMGILGLPCIQANHFGPIDYPLGHPHPTDRDHYAAMLRGDAPTDLPDDIEARAALWLDYMSNGKFALDYRYHARPVTNKVVYPPWWIEEDLETYFDQGDPHVERLAGRVMGLVGEPDS